MNNLSFASIKRHLSFHVKFYNLAITRPPIVTSGEYFQTIRKTHRCGQLSQFYMFAKMFVIYVYFAYVVDDISSVQLLMGPSFRLARLLWKQNIQVFAVFRSQVQVSEFPTSILRGTQLNRRPHGIGLRHPHSEAKSSVAIFKAILSSIKLVHVNLIIFCYGFCCSPATPLKIALLRSPISHKNNTVPILLSLVY